MQNLQIRQLCLMIGFFGVTIGGCANTGASYDPIVDGPRDANYYGDLQDCKAVAKQRGLINGDTKSVALLGAGLGGLSAASDDEGDNDFGEFVGGALIGGLLGSAVGAFETHDSRKYMVMNCMSGRGHRVIG